MVLLLQYFKHLIDELNGNSLWANFSGQSALVTDLITVDSLCIECSVTVAHFDAFFHNLHFIRPFMTKLMCIVAC